GVALTGADANRFRIVSDSGEKKLDPGASRTIQVSFTGVTVASVSGRVWIAAARIASVSYRAILKIRHNDPHPGSPDQITLTADQAAPAGPTGLAARAASAREIDLTWGASSADATSYAIWRKVGSGEFQRYSGVKASV